MTEFDGAPCRPTPCKECPWRRESLAGWLGPMDADEWVVLAHSDQPIACHLTIGSTLDGTESPEVAAEFWAAPNVRQCAGAATYRSNVCKSPRDPNVARLPADRENVFGQRTEFLDHHTRSTT